MGFTDLKTTFADGEHLFAGATTDIDKLNGITNGVNLNAGMLKLMASGAGTTTSTTPVELDSWDVPASTFAATDQIFFVIEVITDTAVPTCTIDITGVTNAGQITTGVIANDRILLYGDIWQHPATNDICVTEYLKIKQTPAISAYYDTDDTNTANWITTAFNIALNGSIAVTGTFYFSWWLYRRANL